MTKASRKKEPTAQAVPVQEDVFARFATLVATAGVDSDARVLQDGGADDNAVNEQLSREWQLAHDRWGLGLLHLKHEARLIRGVAALDVALLTDGMQVATISEGARSIAATYAPMQALGAEGLSEWGVLPDGHRAALKPGLGQLRVLIEDARDFETTWTSERGGLWTRTWRRDETLAVEIHRAASPVTALADAAWVDHGHQGPHLPARTDGAQQQRRDAGGAAGRASQWRGQCPGPAARGALCRQLHCGPSDRAGGPQSGPVEGHVAGGHRNARRASEGRHQTVGSGPEQWSALSSGDLPTDEIGWLLRQRLR